MAYDVHLTREAVKQLGRLPQQVRERLAAALRGLRDNPQPPGSKKLAGGSAHSCRVGSYRILYDIDDAARQVTVFRIRSRKDVYRRMRF